MSHYMSNFRSLFMFISKYISKKLDREVCSFLRSSIYGKAVQLQNIHWFKNNTKGYVFYRS